MQIKNIIFDFGDVFIDLDKNATAKNLKTLGITALTKEMIQINQMYEKGGCTTAAFLEYYTARFPKYSKQEIAYAWNSILLHMPLHRLLFLEELAKQGKYQLFLLSNTNALHIDWIQKSWGDVMYDRFKNCFSQFYLSHEIQLRKPDASIYTFVLEKNNLQANQTFFIDDLKENTQAAQKLGIHTWNICPKTQDVTQLHQKIALL